MRRSVTLSDHSQTSRIPVPISLSIYFDYDPVSWKSASGLIVSQTDAFDSGGLWESKYMLKLIGTGIVEVCEWSDSVADRRFRLGRVLGSKSKLKLIGTGILEVCKWSGSVEDRCFRLGRVLGVEIYA